MNTAICENRIVSQFNAAAEDYNRFANIQRQIAHQLADWIGDLKDVQTALELGCGTGFLTEPLSAVFPTTKLMATDASPRMIEVASRTIENSNVSFSILEVDSQTKLDSEYDLIVSSMTFQWLESLDQVVQNLTESTRKLAFSIPVAGTFANWIAAHESHHLQHGIQDFFDVPKLHEICRGFPNVKIAEYDFCVRFAQPIDFARHLKNIGAGTPRFEHQPVNLRRVFAEFPDGLNIVYKIAFVLIEADL